MTLPPEPLLGAVKEAPMKPTHSQCKALVGSPLLLAASEEQAIREEWKRVMRVYRSAMRWNHWMVKRVANFATHHHQDALLMKACAAARKRK